MKIINREDFLKLPSGTVFCKFVPCAFGDIMIKEDSLENDFCYQSLIGNLDIDSDVEFTDKCFAMSENSDVSTGLDFDCTARDGMFKDDQLFAVYDKDDLKGLIYALEGCVNVRDDERGYS